MVNGPGTSYEPAIAYQGGLMVDKALEAKSGQTQPINAPAADTQRGDQRTFESPDNKDRGRIVDVKT